MKEGKKGTREPTVKGEGVVCLYLGVVDGVVQTGREERRVSLS